MIYVHGSAPFFRDLGRHSNQSLRLKEPTPLSNQALARQNAALKGGATIFNDSILLTPDF
jgi:hypothetical protein